MAFDSLHSESVWEHFPLTAAHRVYKKWPDTFNNDSTLTSALLDPPLHHAETVLIEGKSYRTKDQIEG
jgi:DNA replication protein DnaC